MRQPLFGDSEMSAEGVNWYTSVGVLKPRNEAWGSRGILCTVECEVAPKKQT